MVIRFTMDKEKAIEALIWIIQKGEANVYNIMKVLFAADKYHLNRYGCPVTGDKYVAMRFGTVPSWIYDATKDPKPGIGFTRKGNSLKRESRRMFDRDMFSGSDIEALEHGFKEYAGKDFQSVLLKNHRERAWRKAVERNPEAPVSDILFEDMIIGKKWLIKDLQETGPMIVL